MEMNRKGIRAYQARLIKERKKSKVIDLGNNRVKVLHPTKGWRARTLIEQSIKDNDHPIIATFKYWCQKKLGNYA